LWGGGLHTPAPPWDILKKMKDSQRLLTKMAITWQYGTGWEADDRRS
jgi:hypothetical protein